MEPLIFRDIFIFRTLGTFVNAWSLRRLGCNAELIVDEFGEKLLEELDYVQEARNILVGGSALSVGPARCVLGVGSRAGCGGQRVLEELGCVQGGAQHPGGYSGERGTARGVVCLGERLLQELGVRLLAPS